MTSKLLISTLVTLESLAARLEESEARSRRAERRSRVLSGIVVGGLCLTVTLPLAAPAVAQGYGVTLAQLLNRVIALETKTASMSAIVDPVTSKPTVRFEGVNLQVVNGSGLTEGSINGVGNLIVGYNESLGFAKHTGSHNLIVGDNHSYSSFGGIVVGQSNTITEAFASVSGGTNNIAGGFGASVSGGNGNSALHIDASVTGGRFNTATAFCASVTGGEVNKADNEGATVSGGQFRTASGQNDWRGGSLFQDF